MTRPIFSWRHAILKSELSPTTRLVLLTLSCHMNDAGESCFPSIATLVEETGLSRSSVIAHIKLAKGAGWIRVGLHGFGGQKWKSHEYTSAIPDSVLCCEAGPADRPPLSEGGPAGGPAMAEGGPAPDKKVVQQVDPISTSTNSTLSDNSTRDAPPIGSDPVIQPQPSLPAKRKNPIFSPALMDIPEWLDREVWAMWCEERDAKRKPITYRAGQLQFKKLAEYRDQGFSPQEVIEHSIASGYQGLFPPRGNQHENRRSNSNGFNAIDPNDESWLTDDALAYIESGREIGNRVRAGKPLLRRDDDGVYRLATGDDG